MAASSPHRCLVPRTRHQADLVKNLTAAPAADSEPGPPDGCMVCNCSAPNLARSVRNVPAHHRLKLMNKVGMSPSGHRT